MGLIGPVLTPTPAQVGRACRFGADRTSLNTNTCPGREGAVGLGLIGIISLGILGLNTNTCPGREEAVGLGLIGIISLGILGLNTNTCPGREGL